MSWSFYRTLAVGRPDLPDPLLGAGRVVGRARRSTFGERAVTSSKLVRATLPAGGREAPAWGCARGGHHERSAAAQRRQQVVIGPGYEGLWKARCWDQATPARTSGPPLPRCPASTLHRGRLSARRAKSAPAGPEASRRAAHGADPANQGRQATASRLPVGQGGRGGHPALTPAAKLSRDVCLAAHAAPGHPGDGLFWKWEGWVGALEIPPANPLEGGPARPGS